MKTYDIAYFGIDKDGTKRWIGTDHSGYKGRRAAQAAAKLAITDFRCRADGRYVFDLLSF